METYINQLLEDIKASLSNVPRPYIPPEGVNFWDIPTPDEEECYAPVRALEELTGISKDQLPPAHMLTDDQISRLLATLNELLMRTIGVLYFRIKCRNVFSTQLSARTSISL